MNVTTAWQSFALSGFDNLVSVEFRDPQSGSFLESRGMGIDDIDVTPAPEPQTYALMLAGLALVMGVARRSAARASR